MNAVAARYADRGSLRAGLQRIAPETAQLRRRLFASRRRWTFEHGDRTHWFELLREPGVAADERARITIGGHSAELAFSEGVTDFAGERHWSDYADSARLVAWSIAYAEPLEHLSHVFGASVLPQAMVVGPVTRSDAFVGLGFRIGTGEDAHCSGVLHAPVDVWTVLADRDGGTRPNAALGALLDALPVPLLIRLPGPRLPANELRSLDPGDVFLLGRRADVHARVHLARANDDPASGWRATWAEGRIRVDAAITTTIDSTRSDAMTDPAQEEASSEAASPAAEDAIGKLPMCVDFVLGELSIPFADLASLAPGYVFQVAEEIDNAQVRIRVNGRAIGRGRLVAIGDTLGVEIEGWDDDGLQ